MPQMRMRIENKDSAKYLISQSEQLVFFMTVFHYYYDFIIYNYDSMNYQYL